jgi:hypothetical protein
MPNVTGLIDLKARAPGVAETLSAIGGKLRALGAAAVAAVGIAAIGKALKTIISAAAEDETVMRKFNTVFKEQAQSVSDWADSFAAAMGRNNDETRGFLASLQDLFVPLGFAREDASKMSEAITMLAADLATFNGKTDAEVLNSLQSALVGNTRAVRDYGIVINDAALDAELLKMGITGGTDAATEQQKVIARLNLLMKGSTDAQGAAARGVNTFDGRMRQLTATLDELAGRLGAVLLPIGTKILEGLSIGFEQIAPFLEALFVEIATLFQQSAGWAAELGLTWQNIVTFVEDMLAALTNLKASIGIIGLQIVGFFNDILRGIADKIGDLLNWLAELTGSEKLAEMAKNAKAFGDAFAQGIDQAISEQEEKIAGTYVNVMNEAAKKAFEAPDIQGTIDGILKSGSGTSPTGKGSKEGGKSSRIGDVANEMQRAIFKKDQNLITLQEMLKQHKTIVRQNKDQMDWFKTKFTVTRK